ncbi:MAG TPA: hypothetical protein VHK88_07185 [Aquihabitans sp.]|nr:hypothetical protein [Aquihabitans sp.]
MQPSPPTSAEPWWHRRSPSLGVFVGVLVVLAVASLVLGARVVDVLPEVGKDQLGDDRWSDPLGVELNGQFQIAHLPDCAAGSVTRIALWDSRSEPYWEVAGPAVPLEAFVVGAAPEGFTEVVKFRAPPEGALLRLVVFRRVGGPAGIRYRNDDLRSQRVMSGSTLTAYTVEGFKTAAVCGDGETDNTTPDGAPAGDVGGVGGAPADATTTTSLPG